jgi:hypothetical protein
MTSGPKTPIWTGRGALPLPDGDRELLNDIIKRFLQGTRLTDGQLGFRFHQYSICNSWLHIVRKPDAISDVKRRRLLASCDDALFDDLLIRAQRAGRPDDLVDHALALFQRPLLKREIEFGEFLVNIADGHLESLETVLREKP